MTINIGVIGYGYWGPNIVRNFSTANGATLFSVCDSDSAALARCKQNYKNIHVCSDYRDITRLFEINAVAIITPVSTHFEIAKDALLHQKHIFIAKPFTLKQDEAKELIDIANKNKLIIMVDHTFLFTGAVRKIKSLIDEDALGNLFYYDAIRVNLGLFQSDVNVIWDLAPHDLSIMDYVVHEKPAAISATGADHFSRGLVDMAYVTIFFDSNIITHLNLNWLSPVKIRRTLIGGEKKMLVWNDVKIDEKLMIYDKGVDVTTKEGMYKILVDYRMGDMWSPRLDRTEALRNETQYFIDCIVKGDVPINDGESGLRIVKMLEAADESIRQDGRKIKL